MDSASSRVVSSAALVLGALCAFGNLINVMHHPQAMSVMNVVWSVPALFDTVFLVWACLSYGRLARHDVVQQSQEMPGTTARRSR